MKSFLFLLILISPQLGLAQNVVFIQITDPQFGCFSRNRSVLRSSKTAAKSVNTINKLKPDFAVITGDLVNAWPRGKERTSQVKAFWKVYSRLTVPLYLVPGNHDVGNYPTPRTLSTYKKEFRVKPYFTFYVKSIKFMVLNSSLYWNGKHARKEEKKQHEWFLKNISGTKVVFLHHTIFLETETERYHYFNLPRRWRTPLLEKMALAGVLGIFSGHLHHNKYSRYKNMEVITTSSVSCPLAYKSRQLFEKRTKPGFRMIAIKKINHYWTLSHSFHVFK